MQRENGVALHSPEYGAGGVRCSGVLLLGSGTGIIT